MNNEQLVERLIGLTGNWAKVFDLLDRYPLTESQPEPVIIKKEEATVIEQIDRPQIAIAPPKSPSKQRTKFRAGSLKEQLLEAVEQFSDVTVSELSQLIEFEETGLTQISSSCRDLVEQNYLVRRKNPKGIYVYRSATSN